jgi:hypothetical protein
MTVPPLILKRASTSRQSGQWRDDDHDVLENCVVVGRIFKVPVAPPDRPRMWASRHNGDIKCAAPWTGHDLALGLQMMLRIGDSENLAERTEIRVWGAKWE